MVQFFHIYFTDKLYEITYELYVERIVQFQTFLDNPLSDNIIANYSTPTNSHETHHNNNIIVEQTERLPRIELHKFNGDYNNWESFRDFFQSLLLNKANISNIT